MSARSRWNSIAESVKYLFTEYFCELVYPGYDFALRWKHEPGVGQWVLRRSNAKGAVPAIAFITALGGTVIGGISLGWMSYGDGVFRAFAGMMLALCPFALIRLGASTCLIVHCDGRTTRTDCIYAARVRLAECHPQQTAVLRGTLRHHRHGAKLFEERTGLWLSLLGGGVIVLVSGSEHDVDAYASLLPAPLQERVQEAKGLLYVGTVLL